MKFFTSVALLSCLSFSNAMANSVVIYHTGSAPHFQSVKERLVGKHSIPEKLIRTYLVSDCPTAERSENKLVLCANRKELEVLNSNPSIIKSLAVFKSEEK